MKDKKCTDFVFMPLKDVHRFGVSGDDINKHRLSPVSEMVTRPLTASTTEVRSKIVVVGSCGCGKTALIQRYVQGTFLETYAPTGFDTYSSQYCVSDAYKIHMSIWDTSGDAGYDRVRPLSYSEADLVIICFAIDKPDTIENVIAKWYPEVKEHCPGVSVMLVGCKSDTRGEIKSLPTEETKKVCVTYDQGLKTAKLINALVYSETSSKNSQRSVNDVMEVAALSSAGSKSGCSFTASSSSGTTTTASNGSTESHAISSSGSESPNFERQRSFIRRKRFTGMSEAKLQLRKETAKSCLIM